MSRNNSWKRTVHQEIELRCNMIEGTFLAEAGQAVIDLIGSDRAARQVPISGATNIVRRMLGVTARLYDYSAAFGLDPALVELIGDSSAPTERSRFAAIDTAGGPPVVPMPSMLVEGSEKGGLRDNLEYLQTVGYSGMAIDWSSRESRPFSILIRPCDLKPVYLSDDPFIPARIEWSRERVLDGAAWPTPVTDAWDLTDIANPRFRVLQGTVDVTDRVHALRRALAAGQLSGPGYLWRYADGRPFIPIVIYGRASRVMQGIAITEAALDSVAFRTAAKSAMMDAGFPTREVIGLETGTDSTEGEPGGTSGSAINPGDVRVWRFMNEDRRGEHWQFSAAVDPEMMLRTCDSQEKNAVSQIGFPVELTSTGGEPLAWEVEAQERAIRRWYNIARAGDAELLGKLAAVANRQTGSSYRESGYSVLYLTEVVDALASQAKVKEEPV